MINRLHAWLHRPERGWDPVPPAYASEYGAAVWLQVDQHLLDEIEEQIGGFSGKSVLDLGGGPGQYTIAIALRGGRVTWHDVSRTYLDMTRRKAEEFGVGERTAFSLGYLDDAPRLLSEQYDLVFNRICWNYGLGDRSFSNVVYAMVKPGGYGYVDTTHSRFKRDELSGMALLRTFLNEWSSIKIGHPMPPHGRLARLFLRHPLSRLSVDYRSRWNDRILFQKPSAA
jgi:SAM-dependent methyltransferase